MQIDMAILRQMTDDDLKTLGLPMVSGGVLKVATST